MSIAGVGLARSRRSARRAVGRCSGRRGRERQALGPTRRHLQRQPRPSSRCEQPLFLTERRGCACGSHPTAPRFQTHEPPGTSQCCSRFPPGPGPWRRRGPRPLQTEAARRSRCHSGAPAVPAPRQCTHKPPFRGRRVGEPRGSTRRDPRSEWRRGFFPVKIDPEQERREGVARTAREAGHIRTLGLTGTAPLAAVSAGSARGCKTPGPPHGSAPTHARTP